MSHRYRYKLTVYDENLIAFETEGEDDTILGMRADLEQVVEQAIDELSAED